MTAPFSSQAGLASFAGVAPHAVPLATTASDADDIVDSVPGIDHAAALDGAEKRAEQADQEPSDADFNRAAQVFYEAAGLDISHTSKPEVVNGVRAAWFALLAAQEVRNG